MSVWREGESGVEEGKKWGFRGMRSAILETKRREIYTPSMKCILRI